MKKLCIVLFNLIFISKIFSQNYIFKNVMEFTNDFSELSLYIEPFNSYSDNASGNNMYITDTGNLYIHNQSQKKLLKIDLKLGVTSYVCDLSRLALGNDVNLSFATDSCVLFSGSDFNVKILDGNNKLKADFNNEKLGLNVDLAGIYYDEKSDVLFFRNNSEQRNVCCLVHPSTDNEKNKQNYFNHTETVKIIRNQEYPKMNHLGMSEDEKLTVDGVSYYFPGKVINGTKYQPSQGNIFYLFKNGNSEEILASDFRKKEAVEAIAVHPSGDLYILYFNDSTKIHTLGYIQNTWDPSWRKEWYSTHK